MNTNSAWPWIALIAVAYFAYESVHVVFSSLEEYREKKNECVEEAKKWPPPIPKCDKELWLRITEGCKDGKG